MLLFLLVFKDKNLTKDIVETMISTLSNESFDGIDHFDIVIDKPGLWICGKLVTKIKVNSKFKPIVAKRAVKNLISLEGQPLLACLKTIVSLVTKAKRMPRISPYYRSQ